MLRIRFYGTLFGSLFFVGSIMGQWSDSVARRPNKGFWKSDFALSTATEFSYYDINFTNGVGNDVNFVSNNIMSQTFGLEYDFLSLEVGVSLPVSFLGANSPLTEKYNFGVVSAVGNFRFKAQIYFNRGFYNTTNFKKINISEYDVDPRYNDGLFIVGLNVTGYYFFDKNFKYSLSLSRNYFMEKSGHTFYVSGAFRSNSLISPTPLFEAASPLKQHHLNGLKQILVEEGVARFGFSGFLADNHWFLMGIVGVGLGGQAQSFSVIRKEIVEGKEETFYDYYYRNSVCPALETKLSGGFRARAIYVSLDLQEDALFAALPDKAKYYQFNVSAAITIGIQLNEFRYLMEKRRAKQLKKLF